ncbi:DUF6265 family protein [Myxococcus faecalis]|uniref:DUF6265 family protein n=1 Tax=Myxococcus faecalis TaxID=3115646 RepID=UPI003CEF23C8
MIARPALLALVLGVTPLLGCGSTPNTREPASRECGASIHDVAWLSGSWRQDTAGNLTEEHWTPAAGGTLFGVSRTIVQGKTVFFEYMRIEARKDGLYFVAQPMGRPPSDFKMLRCNSNGVLFENPQHDYPQRIFYQRPTANRLTARIEGTKDGKEAGQSFEFFQM